MKKRTALNRSRDRTGYSLSIIKHYRNEFHKKGKSCVYAFRAIDLETGMYVAFGYPNRSEMEAFRRALKMLKDVEIDSMALDRYYIQDLSGSLERERTFTSYQRIISAVRNGRKC